MEYIIISTEPKRENLDHYEPLAFEDKEEALIYLSLMSKQGYGPSVYPPHTTALF